MKRQHSGLPIQVGMKHGTTRSWIFAGAALLIVGAVLTEIGRVGAGRKAADSNTSVPRDKGNARRQGDLLSLKEEWLALRGNDPDGSGSIRLAEETISRLSCSDDLAELLMMLRESGMMAEWRYLLDKSLLVFSAPGDHQARSHLCNVELLAFRRYWSFEAGLHCPDNEFEEFRDALGDAIAGRNAALGRTVYLAKNDPVAAWRSALENLPEEFYQDNFGAYVDKQTQIVPDWSSTVLGQILENTYSPDDLCTMLALLPPVSQSMGLLHPLRRVRRGLLNRWARYEPKDATDYILTHLADLQPADIFPVSYYSMDLDWIDTNVPKGPYYDYLLDSILDGMEDVQAPEFRAMAERIGDPKRREFNLSRIGDGEH